MINQGEIRRIAGALAVDPRVIDHDYVLGCFLHYLSLQAEVRRHWVFKGGTCLSKCHFDEYRFSEDLDFTALSAVTEQVLLRIADEAKKAMQESIGVRTDIQPTKVDVIQDDYGKESFEARIYYQGPWEYGGSSRSLQVHVNRDELILFPTQSKSINHRYSDKSGLPQASITVYSLEEILSEKLRALSGQRKFAIARDLYDVLFLSRNSINIEALFKAFPRKCEVKGIVVKEINLDRLKNRRPEFEANWKNNLGYLIPEKLKVPFEDAWDVSIDLLNQTIWK